MFLNILSNIEKAHIYIWGFTCKKFYEYKKYITIFFRTRTTI